MILLCEIFEIELITSIDSSLVLKNDFDFLNL